MAKQSASIEDRARKLSAEMVGYLAKTDTHAEILAAALSRERLQALRDAARAACGWCGNNVPRETLEDFGTHQHRIKIFDSSGLQDGMDVVSCKAGPIHELIAATEAAKTT